jgi:soluble lytic murein transglycosylase
MNTIKPKIHFFIFLLVAVSYLNSCQSPKALHDEAHRQQHAKEILSDTYEKSVASRFEKDPELASYIEEYLKSNGRELASREIVRTLIQISKQNQYDPIFLMAVIKTESQFRPHVIGSAGEIGLMQIKPDTAEWICGKKGIKWKGKNSLKDPHYNIEVGALYFKYLKKSLKSKAASYITAYNTGIGNLNRIPASEVRNHTYLSKVLNNYISIYKDLEKIKINRKA